MDTVGRTGRELRSQRDGKAAVPGRSEDGGHAADVDLPYLVVRPSHAVVDNGGRVAGVELRCDEVKPDSFVQKVHAR